MADDWRIRIELPDEARLLDLPLDLHDEARQLARELEGRRLAVSRDGDDLFVYASSQAEAEQARAVVESVLRANDVEARASSVERWLAEEERWSDEPPGPHVEEDALERGYAPWEVRIERPTHREASELADQLEAEGYSVLRRWRYVIAGAESRADADALAARVAGEVAPGGALVYEVLPHNPFAWFGGMGGTGTPL